MSGLYSTEDYAAAFRALMPRGRAWPEDPQSVMMQVLAALSTVYALSDSAAIALLVDAFPVGTSDLLPEWEETLGLPDPCAGDAPTTAQRQAAVHARFIQGGGLSAERYIEFASALGFSIAIAGYATFRAGRAHAGEPVAGDDWAYAWSVTVTADRNALGLDVLRCELEAIKPAATAILIIDATN